MPSRPCGSTNLDERAPRIWIFAGLDPTGHAGLLADVRTLESLGAEARGIATALTWQTDAQFGGLEPTPARVVGETARFFGTEGPPDAIKVGMLGDVENLSILADIVASSPRIPVVVDPVLGASSGGSFLDLAGRRRLLAWVVRTPQVVLTPNWPELSTLARRAIRDVAGASGALASLGLHNVVLKGGHAPAPVAGTDHVWVDGKLTEIRSARRIAHTKRGTGCRFASALAVFLARGDSLPEAAGRAKRLVETYLLDGDAGRTPA